MKTKKNGIWTLVISGVVAVIIVLTFFLARVENIKGEAKQSIEVEINAMKVPQIEAQVMVHERKVAVLEEGVKNIEKKQDEFGAIQLDMQKDIKDLLKR